MFAQRSLFSNTRQRAAIMPQCNSTANACGRKAGARRHFNAAVALVLSLAVITLASGCTGQQNATTAQSTAQATVTTAPTARPTEAPRYYSYAEIASSLYDLTKLAQYSTAKSAQFSSYDRRSRYMEDGEQYLLWDANLDGNGSLGKENGEYVLARMQGAGYINRIWIGNATWVGDSGLAIMSIYIDGNEQPVLSAPVRELISSKYFDYDELCYSCVPRGGHNLYLPITYNNGCKVTISYLDNLYYHIGYTSLAEGCTTDSFTYPLSTQMAQAAEAANGALKAKPKAQNERSITLQPGQSADILASNSAGAVTGLAFDADIDDPFEETDALQSLVLAAYWDGSNQPAVWASLAQFFAQTQPTGGYSTFALGRQTNGLMYSNYYMPYNSARITLTNQGDKELTVKAYVSTAGLESADGLLRFCASWRRMGSQSYTGAGCDSGFISLNGTGRFVGMALHAYQSLPAAWWGEGDEKLFVDGEKFPSFFGTGTEDYFGFSWADNTLFSRPYHAQLVCDNYYGGGDGNKVNMRLQISDSVCFLSRFDGSIENYYPENYFAATSYYYLSAACVNANAAAQSTLIERTAGFYGAAAPREKYEGEMLNSYSRLSALVQGGNDKWSGSLQLLWPNRSKTGELTVYMRVEQAGSYDINACLSTSYDFGIFDVDIDGVSVYTGLDLYGAEPGAPKEYSFDRVELSPGLHRMRFKCTGKNAASSSYLMGIDYFTVKAQQ